MIKNIIFYISTIAITAGIILFYKEIITFLSLSSVSGVLGFVGLIATVGLTLYLIYRDEKISDAKKRKDMFEEFLHLTSRWISGVNLLQKSVVIFTAHSDTMPEYVVELERAKILEQYIHLALNEFRAKMKAWSFLHKDERDFLINMLMKKSEEIDSGNYWANEDGSSLLSLNTSIWSAQLYDYLYNHKDLGSNPDWGL